jgi:acyl-CoA thioesterase
MDAGADTATFAGETAVVPDPHVAGRYHAVFSDRWCAPQFPQGGITTVAALRAMTAALAVPEQTLRTVTNVFAAPVRTGPAEIDVTVARRGRSVSQVSATVRSEGEAAGQILVAAFGTDRPGFEFTDVAPPEVAPPHDCPSFRDPLPEGVEWDRVPPTFWERIEGRPAMGHPPWEAYTPVSSECAEWYRYDEAPRLEDGRLDPLMLIPFADTMPGAVRERMGNDVPQWMPPSIDLTVHLFGPPRSEWILAHNRARFASDGYASAEMVLWDPEVGLVAYATQVMLLVFNDGPPEPHQIRPPSS